MRKRAFRFVLLCLAVPAIALFCANHEWSPLAPGAKADHIVVEKTARKLTLFHGSAPLKTYRVALGGSPIGHKEREGDHRTPEGTYTIDYRNGDSRYHRALHVSYPSPRDIAQAARQGVSPGGDIMIHGMRNGLGWLGSLHRFHDWTAGCIAVSNAEIEEIWRTVPNGTTIEIRP